MDSELDWLDSIDLEKLRFYAPGVDTMFFTFLIGRDYLKVGTYHPRSLRCLKRGFEISFSDLPKYMHIRSDATKNDLHAYGDLLQGIIKYRLEAEGADYRPISP